ncbi:MAG: chemotaxis-related protein WspD [Bacteroidota bacterium]|nr:chemotaxis-related protein WspD [Bacteroidota bacterium]
MTNLMESIKQAQIEKCWKNRNLKEDPCEELIRYGHCRHCPEYSRVGRSLLNREIPEGSIEEWTKNIAGEKESGSAGDLSIVIFRIKNEWLGLNSHCFTETVELKPIHSIPLRTDNLFSGVVNVNGELLICISASHLLDISDEIVTEDSNTKNVYKRMVVVNKDSERYVFPVDEILGVVRIDSEDLRKAPVTLSKSPNTFSVGVYSIHDKNVGILDETKFFNSLKRSLAW